MLVPPDSSLTSCLKSMFSLLCRDLTYSSGAKVLMVNDLQPKYSKNKDLCSCILWNKLLTRFSIAAFFSTGLAKLFVFLCLQGWYKLCCRQNLESKQLTGKIFWNKDLEKSVRNLTFSGLKQRSLGDFVDTRQVCAFYILSKGCASQFGT